MLYQTISNLVEGAKPDEQVPLETQTFDLIKRVCYGFLQNPIPGQTGTLRSVLPI